jgi:flagellar biogenesis protein FliO
MRKTQGAIRRRRIGALVTSVAAALCASASAQVGQSVGPPSPSSQESAQPSAPTPTRAPAKTIGDLLLAGVEQPGGAVLVTADDAFAAAPPRTSESRPLGAARQSSDAVPIAPSTTGPSVTDGWLGRTVVALAFVIGLAVVIRSIVRRVGRTGGGLTSQLGVGGRAPSGVLLVLGRYPISRGQTLVLLKVDRRVLLLCQSQAGFQTLSEITDPEEVASLLVKTRDESGDSLSHRFNSLLRRVERDPSMSGEIASVLPESRVVEIKDDDSWAAQERWGGAATGVDHDDPVRMLRRRLQSLSGGAS